MLLPNSYLHPHVLRLVLFLIGEILQPILAKIVTLLATHVSVQALLLLVQHAQELFISTTASVGAHV